ncbi:UPF0481 protein At3g47200-like isoform X2 [Ipomoea triloba]|uniref:UPF0481 protein At3g47200-like isoform X2 n=2 Tax=Ipomoea triloba TaxID=35885 RepID=UPI00125E9B6D|nr:UPF0481 protein At3g47200-like isoform X2 [Ipomoea triloba]XP_031096751.1 UPF0481 protein At3g47200-like isoform X2 [Ipomoea triloba]
MSVKQKFKESLFGKINKFEEHSTQKLKKLLDKARSCYTDDTQKMNDDDFVEMLLLDGCFILEFLEKYSEKEVTEEFMKVKGNLVQTLIDMTLLENQIPFFVLFELFKLKRNNENKDDVLLQDLIVLVKRCIGTQVPKLTPRNIEDHDYKPDTLPKHLVEVVHNLCIPRNPKCGRHSCRNDSWGITEQINTATELEADGVEFKKVGKVYERYFGEKEGAKHFNSKDNTTMFDLEFINGTLKIPSFKIDDGTETLLRNMIAYEQHSTEASVWFSDFASFMDQLIEDTKDVNLLRRRGIIVNCMAQDKMVAEMFENLCQDVINYNTFSGVIRKVNLHVDKAWNVWFGKLRHDLSYSPWKLISAVAGGLVVTVTTTAALRNILR